MQKDFAFWVGHEGGQSQVGNFRVRVNATQESAQAQESAHTPRMQKILDLDGLDQNILHFAQDLTLLIKIPWISLVSSSSIHPPIVVRIGSTA
jgi:hypothetical protein